MKHEYKLSICMMIKDEEKNLERCLKSVKPLIDSGISELIIIDTGSVDKSVDIAKEYTRKVYLHKWNNNFSDMRNISISYAKGEWIFIIDADEKLDNPFEIINIMNSKDINDYNCIILKVKNLYKSNDENQYNLIASPRIFKNDGTFRYEGAVHNQPIFKGPLLNTDICLTHFGYINTDKLLMEKKFKRTSELLKAELLKDPNNLYYLYQLGVSYDMHGDHKEALYEFRKAYSILKPLNKDIKKKYIYIYSSYIRAAYTNKAYEEVMEIFNEAILLSSDYIDLYYLAGITQEQLKNKSQAVKYFLKYAELYNKYNELEISRDLSLISYHIDNVSKSNVYFSISDYYYNKNDYKKAEYYSRQINDNVKRAYMFAKIYLKQEEFEKLRKYYIDIEDKETKECFLIQLEHEAKSLNEDQKKHLYKEFSDLNDEYGLFNRIRVCKDEKIDKLLQELFGQVDFNKAPIFYYDAYSYLKYNIKFMISTFKKINTSKIRHIVKYLIDKDYEFSDIIVEYFVHEPIRENDLQSNRIFIAVTAVVLIEAISKTNNKEEKYYELFKSYIKRGINYISLIYQIQKSRIIYKEINNDEDKFFILMFIVHDYISKGDIKTSIKYMKEALNCYKLMAKYINLYKDELYELTPEGERHVE